MKKFFTLMLLAIACSVNMQAQEYNLFDAEDVDADGWLWFDTDEKIEKYVGICNEEDYKVNPNGKLVQLIYADIMPDYPASYADSRFVGVGIDGDLEGEGAKTGSLVIAPASANMTINGGGFVVCMPSCSSYSIALSSEAKMYVRMLATKDVNTSFTNYDVISAKYASVFKPLSSAGMFTWTGIETLDNGKDDAYKLQTNAPIYAYFQSLSKYEMYIHGIKVMTTTNPAGVEEAEAGKDKIFYFNNTVSLNEEAQIEVYNVAGVLVESAFAAQLSLNDMNKGIYFVKVGNNTRKVTVK